MKITIDIENRIINKKDTPCYIPKINNVSILGEHGYILKNSINDKGEVTDNIELANTYLQVKIDEINSFMDKNSKFLNN